MPSAIQRELALLVTGKDVSASKTLGGVSRKISGLEKHTSKAASNISRNLERGVVIGAGAAGVALGFAVKSAIDWESAVAGVAKTVDGDVSQITDGILDMSRKVPLAATELAGLAETAGALGIAKDEIVDFTEVAATLGVTTNVTADQAATSLGQLRNLFGLQREEFSMFGSALVDLGNKGASTEAQILEITTRASGAAAMLKFSAAETLGWSSALANLGLNEELAGTAFQNFLLQSQRLVSTKAGLEGLADVAGTTAAKFEKAFKKDAPGALESFIKGLGKLPADERVKVVGKLFKKGSGINRALLGLAETYAKNLAPSVDTATAAWQKNNAMAIEAEKRYATTASKLQILQNNVKFAAVTIGSKLLPLLAELSDDAVGWIDEHQGDIEKFSEDLASGIKDAVTFAKGLDWDKIATALSAGADAAKTLAGAFLSLPPELLSLLAGGFAVNKLTGGVVVDIATDALKDQVFSRGASPANPLWVKQVGMPGVGGAAGATGGLGVLSKVFLVGEAIGLALLVEQTRQDISAGNTQVATAVQDQTTRWLAAQPNKEALAAGLRGVEQGIANLKSNPLNVLVQGEALAKLEAMRTAILAQQADMQPNGRSSTTQAEFNRGDVFGPGGLGQSLSEATRQNADRVTTSVEGMKGRLAGDLAAAKAAVEAGTSQGMTDAQATGAKITAGTAATTAGAARTATAASIAGAVAAAATAVGSSQIVGAIRSIPTPNTFVNVNITATGVQSATTTQNRSGGTPPSRQRDLPGASGP